MNKAEFLGELERRLSGLKTEEITPRLAYYEEMIDARVAYGLSEEEAVNEIGSVDSVVDLIMSEIPLSRFVSGEVAPGRNKGSGKLILLLLTFPLWLPLIIVLFTLIITFYIVIWTLVIGLFTVVLAFAVAALGSLLISIPFFISGSFSGGGFMIGLSMIMLGLTILMFNISALMTRGMIRLSRLILLGIKSCFVGKRDR